jgi:fumarylacetoacetate (FAA) hydrolase
MKIVSYRPIEQEGMSSFQPLKNNLLPAVLIDDMIVDLVRGIMFFRQGTTVRESVTDLVYDRAEIQKAIDKARSIKGKDMRALSPDEQQFSVFAILKPEQIRLSSPVFLPTSLRDFYAFEQHVKTANENRGRSVPEEWYQFPVFYFTNASTISGPDDTIPYPSYSDALDYELEIACVIGKAGIDIPAAQAEDYIFGFTIMNDWSARDVQRLEMKAGLGPAKGKDFATSLGPCIVTLDELADRYTGRPGVYDLEMVARVNGIECSRGNMKDLYWSYGQMIERASQDVWLQPGDVIGSGTVGTGCLLERTKGQGPWLQPGDVVELEIERIGVLRNTVGENRKKSV